MMLLPLFLARTQVMRSRRHRSGKLKEAPSVGSPGVRLVISWACDVLARCGGLHQSIAG